MAILTYDGTNGIFTATGKIVKYLNTEWTRTRTTLLSDLDAMADVLEASNSGNRRDVTAAINSHILTLQRDTLMGIERSNQSLELRLRDRDKILDMLKLSLPDASEESMQILLSRLIDEMDEDSKTVDASTVTIGTVTADADNVGNGVVLCNKVMDGVTAPCKFSRANRWYNAVDSELAPSETVTIECIRDAQGTVLPPPVSSRSDLLLASTQFVEGSELFRVYGQQPSRLPQGLPRRKYGFGYGLDAEGSGDGPQFNVLNSNTAQNNIIFNRNFESFGASNAPDSWLDSSLGTAGVNVFKETTAANVYRGLSSLKYTGDGATAVIKRSQSVSARALVGRKRYYFSVWIIGSATIAAGDIAILFTGTGYTAASSEKVSIAAASIPTAWTRYGFYWNTPASIPSDLKLEIQWNGTPTTSKSIWIDDIAFGPVTYHGGLNYVAISGATPFKAGDKWTVANTNDEAGTINRHAARRWGIQFPSNNAGAENIADSLYE